jgi:hypothetical protein
MIHKYTFSENKGGYPIGQKGEMKDLCIPMGLVLSVNNDETVHKKNIYSQEIYVIEDEIFDTFLDLVSVSKKRPNKTRKNQKLGFSQTKKIR